MGDCSFLVRPSDKSPSDYTLYFNVDQIVHRFRIATVAPSSSNHSSYFQIGGRDYTSISAIVEHYMHDEISVGCRLSTQPHKRAAAPIVTIGGGGGGGGNENSASTGHLDEQQASLSHSTNNHQSDTQQQQQRGQLLASLPEQMERNLALRNASNSATLGRNSQVSLSLSRSFNESSLSRMQIGNDAAGAAAAALAEATNKSTVAVTTKPTTTSAAKSAARFFFSSSSSSKLKSSSGLSDSLHTLLSAGQHNTDESKKTTTTTTSSDSASSSNRLRFARSLASNSSKSTNVATTTTTTTTTPRTSNIILSNEQKAIMPAFAICDSKVAANNKLAGSSINVFIKKGYLNKYSEFCYYSFSNTHLATIMCDVLKRRRRKTKRPRSGNPIGSRSTRPTSTSSTSQTKK